MLSFGYIEILKKYEYTSEHFQFDIGGHSNWAIVYFLN